jgi:hypothetical protein
MKDLKTNEQTRSVSLVLLGIYVIYGIFKIPLLEYGVSILIGAMIYLATKMPEFGVLGVLVCTMLLPMLRFSNEGFADTPATVPTDKATEAADDSSTKDAAEGVSPSPVPSYVGSSTPASASPTPVVIDTIREKNLPPATQPADLISAAAGAADGFADSNSGLFKLGQIPTDEKGGFHIDAGTSVLNALKSLKPDQISAMTQDTKQLIETQKTLMNMLQSFKPMLTEGKDMMDTFQQMFSPAGGSAMGALQAAQETLKN